MRPITIRVIDTEAGTTQAHDFVRSPVRLGRNPLNDLPLEHPFVSSWHAVLRFDEHGATYHDLGSTNGTAVAGRALTPGQATEIGASMTFEIGPIHLQVSRPDLPSHVAKPVPEIPLGTPRSPALSMTSSRTDMASSAIDTDDSIRPQVRGGETAKGSPSQTAFMNLARVHACVRELESSYTSLVDGHKAWIAERKRVLDQLTETERDTARAIIDREYPPLFPHRSEAATGTIGADAPSDAVLQSMAELSSSLIADELRPVNADEARQFYARTCEVLLACARAFVELQRGQEQFGREMGVRTIKEYNALHAAGDAEGVLNYLLDWRSGGPERTAELVGAFADVMIHQIALLNGFDAGVRSLLAQLDPEDIDREVSSPWPARAKALWREFEHRFESIADNHAKRNALVFGQEFARAYTEAGGQRERLDGETD